MAAKIDDASIEIEIKPEKAKRELEKFERALDREAKKREEKIGREGDKARDELERERVQAQRKLKAFKKDTAQGIQEFVRSGSAAALTKFLPAKLQPFARPAVNLAELTAEFGPAAAKGALKGAPLDPITKGILLALTAKSEVFARKIQALSSALQAIGPTVDQVASVGLAIARGPGGEHLDEAFLPDFGVKLYDFNKAQIVARRRARQIGVEQTSETVVKIMSRGFER